VVTDSFEEQGSTPLKATHLNALFVVVHQVGSMDFEDAHALPATFGFTVGQALAKNKIAVCELGFDQKMLLF